jgi:hypothetical protein
MKCLSLVQYYYNTIVVGNSHNRSFCWVYIFGYLRFDELLFGEIRFGQNHFGEKPILRKAIWRKPFRRKNLSFYFN